MEFNGALWSSTHQRDRKWKEKHKERQSSPDKICKFFFLTKTRDRGRMGRDRVLVNRDRGYSAATAGWLNFVGSLSAGAALGDAAVRWLQRDRGMMAAGAVLPSVGCSCSGAACGSEVISC